MGNVRLRLETFPQSLADRLAKALNTSNEKKLERIFHQMSDIQRQELIDKVPLITANHPESGKYQHTFRKMAKRFKELQGVWGGEGENKNRRLERRRNKKRSG